MQISPSATPDERTKMERYVQRVPHHGSLFRCPGGEIVELIGQNVWWIHIADQKACSHRGDGQLLAKPDRVDWED